MLLHHAAVVHELYCPPAILHLRIRAEFRKVSNDFRELAYLLYSACDLPQAQTDVKSFHFPGHLDKVGDGDGDGDSGSFVLTLAWLSSD